MNAKLAGILKIPCLYCFNKSNDKLHTVIHFAVVGNQSGTRISFGKHKLQTKKHVVCLNGSIMIQIKEATLKCLH